MHTYIIPSAIQKCIRGSCAAFKWGRIVLPLIGTTFSNCSTLWHTLSTLTLTTTTASICVWFTPYCSPTSLPTSGSQSTLTASSPPSQLIIIMIALAVTTVLLLLVVVVVVVMVGLVAMVTVVRRRQSKEHVYENNNTDRSMRVQTRSNSLQSTTYYEPVSPNIGPSHPHHQPHPLPIPRIKTKNTGDDITMEDCPAYQSMDIHTSGEQAYI